MKQLITAVMVATLGLGASAAFTQASGAMGNDAMSHDSMSKDGMSHDSMSKGAMKHDSMGKGSKMKKHDAMGMSHSAFGRDVQVSGAPSNPRRACRAVCRLTTMPVVSRGTTGIVFRGAK